MTLEEQIRFNANIIHEEEILTEGLRFFRTSKKIARAVMRTEKSLQKFQENKYYEPLRVIVSGLKEVGTSIEKIENDYSKRLLPRKVAKERIKKLTVKMKKLNMKAKSSVGIDIMKRSKLKIALSIAGGGILGVAASIGSGILDINDVKNIVGDTPLGKKLLSSYSDNYGEELKAQSDAAKADVSSQISKGELRTRSAAAGADVYSQVEKGETAAASASKTPRASAPEPKAPTSASPTPEPRRVAPVLPRTSGEALRMSTGDAVLNKEFKSNLNAYMRRMGKQSAIRGDIKVY